MTLVSLEPTLFVYFWYLDEGFNTYCDGYAFWWEPDCVPRSGSLFPCVITA